MISKSYKFRQWRAAPPALRPRPTTRDADMEVGCANFPLSISAYFAQASPCVLKRSDKSRIFGSAMYNKFWGKAALTSSVKKIRRKLMICECDMQQNCREQ